jgi:hypothetical protein
VRKLDVVPKRVFMVAERSEAIFAVKLFMNELDEVEFREFRLVADALLAKRFVDVELVLVALVDKELVEEILVVKISVKKPVTAVKMDVKKLVDVASVRLALFAKRLVDVLFVPVELAKVRLPAESALKLVFSTQLDPFHLRVDDVAVPEAIDPPLPARSIPQENSPVAAL